MKRLIAFLILLQFFVVSLAQDSTIRVPIRKTPKPYVIVGQLGEKLGTVLTVRGIIAEGPFKGYAGGPNLVVQFINDSATQHLIQIPLSPYYQFEFNGKDLPKLKNGVTYRFLVYETGEYVGEPTEAYKEADKKTGIFITPQTAGLYFQNKLIVISGEKIDPIEWSPSNFLGRNAIISGTAKNENDTAVIQKSNWKLKLIGCRKWMDSEIGKVAEVRGNILKTETPGIYSVENGDPRLINLEDQLGKTVRLRGRAINSNQYWWFNYRGTDIYVENLENLPNWTNQNHFRPMEITGLLEQAKLADLDQVTEKTNPDRKLYYIVRKASWKPITELLAPELKLKVNDDDN